MTQQDRIDDLESECERWRTQLELIADCTEAHWRGAGAPLEAKWIIDSHTATESRVDELLDERDALRARLAQAELYNTCLEELMDSAGLKMAQERLRLMGAQSAQTGRKE